MQPSCGLLIGIGAGFSTALDTSLLMTRNASATQGVSVCDNAPVIGIGAVTIVLLLGLVVGFIVVTLQLLRKFKRIENALLNIDKAMNPKQISTTANSKEQERKMSGEKSKKDPYPITALPRGSTPSGNITPSGKSGGGSGEKSPVIAPSDDKPPMPKSERPTPAAAHHGDERAYETVALTGMN